VRGKLVEIAQRLGAEADQVALAWILALPSRPLPILGTNRLERITSAAGALELNLDRQSWYEIYEAALGQGVP
jgi:predicted oxidoreductase